MSPDVFALSENTKSLKHVRQLQRRDIFEKKKIHKNIKTLSGEAEWTMSESPRQINKDMTTKSSGWKLKAQTF